MTRRGGERERSGRRNIPMVPMPGTFFQQQSSRSSRRLANKDNSSESLYQGDGSGEVYVGHKDKKTETSYQNDENENVYHHESTSNIDNSNFEEPSKTKSLYPKEGSAAEDEPKHKPRSRSSIDEYKSKYEMALKSNSDQSIYDEPKRIEADYERKDGRVNRKTTGAPGREKTPETKKPLRPLPVPLPEPSNSQRTDDSENSRNRFCREGGWAEKQKIKKGQKYEDRYKETNEGKNRKTFHHKTTPQKKQADDKKKKHTPIKDRKPMHKSHHRGNSLEGYSVATKSTRDDSSIGGTGNRARECGEAARKESDGQESTTGTIPSVQSVKDDVTTIHLPQAQTIALLGGSGMTGRRFLHSALDAGYDVRCLPSDDPRQTYGKNTTWKIIQAEMEDTQQLEILLHGASYVVVMVNDLLPRKHSEYPSLFLTKLVSKLYVLMRMEQKMDVFLFQSNSLASDIMGQTPVLSKVVKTTTRRWDPFMIDLDTVMKRIANEHGMQQQNKKDKNGNDENKNTSPARPKFSFLVTRPTILLQNGPGCKRLFASKSQPGPVPISHVDLAEFTLNALTTTKIHNSSPYVVADCF